MAGGAIYPWDRGSFWTQYGPGSTVIKPCSGRIGTMTILAASSTACALYDSTTVGGIASGNQFFLTPATTVVGTIYVLDWPFVQGAVVTVGTAGLVAISWV